MVTSVLQVFSINVYALLDVGVTLLFFTHFATRKFDILPDIFNEPSIVTTPLGESLVAKRVYRNSYIMFPDRVTHVELVELDMVILDVILGIDQLHAFFASIGCRTRVVKSNFSNETVLEWKWGSSILRGHIISCLKVCKNISKGCLYHIVRLKNLDSKTPPIELIPIVREFP